jgi:hypothetical protein
MALCINRTRGTVGKNSHGTPKGGSVATVSTISDKRKGKKAEKPKAEVSNTSKGDLINRNQVAHDTNSTAAAPIVNGNNEEDICLDCGTTVMSQQQGLLCDTCGLWHHTQCEKVADEIYEFLCEHTEEQSLTWNCRKCIASNRKILSVLTSFSDLQQRMEARVSEAIQTMNRKIEDLSELLNKNVANNEPHKCLVEKVDALMTMTLREQVGEKMDDMAERMGRKMDELIVGVNRNLENKNTDQQSTDEEAQKRVEWSQVELKVDALLDTVKQKMDVNGSIGEVVSNKLREDQEELEDIRKRRTNVIMHGLKESTSDDIDQRRQEDEDQIVNLLHSIRCDNISVATTTRLGKRQEDPVKNPRSLLMCVASEDQKDQILKLAKNLRGRKEYEKVFIQQDLTLKQRRKRSELVNELKQRRAAGEKNLILVNDKIVLRWQNQDQFPVQSTAN